MFKFKKVALLGVMSLVLLSQIPSFLYADPAYNETITEDSSPSLASAFQEVLNALHGILRIDKYNFTMSGVIPEGVESEDALSQKASFYMALRKPHEECGYNIITGIEQAVHYLQTLMNYNETQLQFLKDNNIPAHVIEYLREAKLEIEVDAAPEGTVVLDDGPVLRITGPIIQCRLFEAIMVSAISSSTNLTTYCSMLTNVVEQYFPGANWADFSLRRNSPESALVSALYAYLGGAFGTSNMEAGITFNIPTCGTMAHNYVANYKTLFPDLKTEVTEQKAFLDFIKTYPENAVLLIDTYRVEQGIDNAIEAAIAYYKTLSVEDQNNFKLKGVRIDSGDTFINSQLVQKKLDEAAITYPSIFSDTGIGLTDGLNAQKIQELGKRILAAKANKKTALEDGAHELANSIIIPTRINFFGIGTKIADQMTGAKGATLKLAAAALLQQLLEGKISLEEAQRQSEDIKLAEMTQSLEDESLNAGKEIDQYVDHQALQIVKMQPTCKIGDVPSGRVFGDKTSYPGIALNSIQLFDDNNKIIGSLIYDAAQISDISELLSQSHYRKTDEQLMNLPHYTSYRILLQPLFRKNAEGVSVRVSESISPTVTEVRKTIKEEIRKVPDSLLGYKPDKQHTPPVFMSAGIYDTLKEFSLNSN